MLLETENEYDGGTSSGDGNLTQQTKHVDATTTRVTAFAYDWRNRLVEIDREEDYFEWRFHDNLGRIVQTERYDTTSSGNLVARNESLFDERGRVYRTVKHSVDPDTGSLTGETWEQDTFYDAAGDVLRREPNGDAEFVEFAYDGLNRMISRTDPLGHATTYSYDDAGNQVSVTDPTNHTSTTGHDPLGRVVMATDPLGHETKLAYDAAGRQDSVTDANGHATTTVYDDAGRPVSVTDPLGHATS